MEDPSNIYQNVITEYKKRLDDSVLSEERLDILLQFGERLLLITPKDAMPYAIEALEEATKRKDYVSMGRAHNIISSVHLHLSQFELSEKYLKKTKDYFEQNDLNSPVLYETYIIYGALFYNQGKFKESKEYRFKCLEIAKNIENTKSYIRACALIAQSYYKLGNIPDATLYVEKGLKKNNGIENSGLASLYNMAGILNSYQNLTEKAVAYYQKALKIWEGIGYYFHASYVYNNLGIISIKTKDYDQAIEQLEKAKELFEIMGVQIHVGLAYHNIGDAYLGKSEQEESKESRQIALQKSMENQQKALQIAMDVQDKFGIVQTTISLVQTKMRLGHNVANNLTILKSAETEAEKMGAKILQMDIHSLFNSMQNNLLPEERLDILLQVGERLSLMAPDDALPYALEALEVSTKKEDHISIGRANNILGYIHCSYSQFELTEKYLKKVREYFEEHDPNSPVLYRTYFIYGRLSSDQGKYKEGKDYYFKCLEIAKNIKDTESYIKACAQIAKSYYKLGDISEASMYVEEGLKRDNGIENDGLAYLYNIVGILYSNQNVTEKAKFYYKKALKIWEGIGYYFYASFVYNNLGVIYIKTEDYDLAIEHFEKAMELFKKMGAQIHVGLAHHNIGDAYLDKGEYEKSIENQQKSLQIALDVQDKFGVIQSSMSLVVAKMHLGHDVADNLTILEAAKTEAERIDAKMLLRDIHKISASIYEAENDFDKAFKHQSTYLKLQEKIKEKTLKDIERRYEFVLKEKELELLNQEQEILELHNRELQVFAKKAGDNLKTDIATINLYSNLILQSVYMGNDEASLEQLEVIEKSAQSVFEKISNLTRYTLAGVEEFDYEEFDLNDLIFIAQNQLKKEFAKVGGSLEIKRDLPMIYTGYNGLLQVIHILLGNAIKFRKQDEELLISIDYKEDEEFVNVEVTDNGIGLKKEDFERVFNVFESVNAEDSSSGSGIGLATAKRILKKLGGNIYVESEEGKGSTFFFSLPKTINKAS